MRIDQFLNATNILKSRSIAQDMCANNAISINGVRVKASKEVRIGDKIGLHFLDYTTTYIVLALPTTPTTPKSAKHTFIRKLGADEK